MPVAPFWKTFSKYVDSGTQSSDSSDLLKKFEQSRAEDDKQMKKWARRIDEAEKILEQLRAENDAQKEELASALGKANKRYKRAREKDEALAMEWAQLSDEADETWERKGSRRYCRVQLDASQGSLDELPGGLDASPSIMGTVVGGLGAAACSLSRQVRHSLTRTKASKIKAAAGVMATRGARLRRAEQAR